MVTNSTNINKMNKHPSLQITINKKKPWHMLLVIQLLVLSKLTMWWG